MSSRLQGSPQDLPRAGPFAIEICPAEGQPGKGPAKCKFYLVWCPTGEKPADTRRLRKQPGRQEETIGIASEVPRGGRWEARRESPGGMKGHFGREEREGGRKGPFGQPGDTREAPGTTREAGKGHLDSLGGTREAGKDHLDSLRGTREAPERQEREAPGRQERSNWTACEAPGHQD